MAIFDMLFGKHSHQLAAPVSGHTCKITEVSDITFREEILGKGIAIRPTEGKIFAPCNGFIDTMFETGHAVSIQADFGAEVLIHVGLDTVNLRGKYFTVHHIGGDSVKQGDLLIEFDLDAITAEGYDMITPVVICNSQDFSVFDPYVNKTVVPGDPILELAK